MKAFIKTISFLYKGERRLIEVNRYGKFKIPVSKLVQGKVRTRFETLTAKQFVFHEIIKNCDPTLYLDNGERIRVFTGGDSSYLPAQIQGFLEKHDNLYKIKIPKSKLKTTAENKKNLTISDYPGYNDYGYDQHSMDLNGWYDDTD
jgi:hypothetical protein